MGKKRKRNTEPRAEDFPPPTSSGWHVLCDDGWLAVEHLNIGADALLLNMWMHDDGPMQKEPLKYEAGNFIYEASFRSKTSGIQRNPTTGKERTLCWFSRETDCNIIQKRAGCAAVESQVPNTGRLQLNRIREEPSPAPFPQRVHVLLHPRPQPAVSITSVEKPLVGVMGFHRSGTHALLKYMQLYFDVEYEPMQRKSSGDGNLILANDFQIWKHTVPLGPWNLPHCGKTGRPLVLVVLLVRDVQCWMTSLSNHAYEIFPHPRRKRCKGRLDWMFSSVKVTTGSTWYPDPFPDSLFSSVPALWAEYVRGYLSATMSGPSASPSPTFLILRHEDLVQRPGDVIERLACFGLPRNQVPFAPIESHIVPHASSQGIQRCTLVSDIVQQKATQQLIDQGLLQQLREQLASSRHLFDMLGYEFP